MRLALREITALRNVIVHRAGRVDDRALREAPTLATVRRMSLGDFVRIGRVDYRMYSAALRSYGDEVLRRLFRASPEFSDLFDFDLIQWRARHHLGHNYVQCTWTVAARRSVSPGGWWCGGGGAGDADLGVGLVGIGQGSSVGLRGGPP